MSLQQPIYLDYNATTPVAPDVLETMLPYFTQKFGNAASSNHAYGWIAKEATEKGRNQIASVINAEPNEIVFTSGATESINLAIKGVCEKYVSKGNHIVTVSTEHKAVLNVCNRMEQSGFEVSYLNVDREGLIDLQELEKSITDKTILVCTMIANNETGVIHPIEAIAKIVHDKKSILFCDATQAVGKIKVDVVEQHIDLLCMSAHKLYGPKGVGALYVRRKNPRITVAPLIDGGGHENGLRSGTLNVPGIVGFGKACELAQQLFWDDAHRISALRTRLEQALTIDRTNFINGSIKNRLPNTTNICFKGIESTTIIKALGNLAVATGSACTSALMQPSHVLKAMHLTDNEADSSIRFSLGRFTTNEEIGVVVERFQEL